MHHENDNKDGFFVFLAMETTNIFGEENENKTHTLPLMDVIKNQVFDRGKGGNKFWWPGAITCK